MNRKQFIGAQGATCSNWQWSWSFINEADRVIIFGAWDLYTKGNTSLILSESWQVNENGRKKPAYKQSRDHIRLIEKEGYKLKTFPIIYSDARKDENGIGHAKIESFIPKLTEKSLKKVGNSWYASDDALSNLLPEKVDAPEQYIEGLSKTVSVNTYERNTNARTKCIEHHGYKCAICSFDFEAFYGAIGKNYIHVHHVVPLAEIGREYELNPIKDLVPVCPNCHAIIHRTRPALSVEQLKKHLSENARNT
ncbi:MAG: HNH endonuclease [Deltaproteobacteria bacterium]|nr:HNH endonuclease [Deltaproteobacteria bacterium]